MKAFSVKIEGVSPLLCNRFTDEAAMKATAGTTITTVGDRGTPREIAESKLYIGLDGAPMIPQPNLFRCLIESGKWFKAGKSKVTTQKSSMIPACVDLAGITRTEEIDLQFNEPWDVDTRPVRIPSTGGRILCHRPRFHDWTLQFRLELDESLLSAKMLRELVDAAGKRVGLGDFRPDCKGPFGKFVVTHWELERAERLKIG